MAVSDLKEFHQENFKMNKKHYPALARLLKHKYVTYFQERGAKVHFNYFEHESYGWIRYGVVEYSDLLRDLKHWETLVTSSYMHRPFNII